MTKRRMVWFAGLAVPPALLATALVAYWAAFGVRVTVANEGTTLMRDVVVHVTGRSYSVGDLPPGSSKSVRVLPSSESHVEIEFTDEQDQRVRLASGPFFEPGYRGEVRIRAGDGEIKDVQGQPLPSLY